MSGLLKASQKAPSFSSKDVFGKQVALSNFDSKYVLLVFLRYSGCPWCNLAINRLALEYKQLQKDKCQVVAFIQSDKNDIMNNVYGMQSPKPRFPIVADHDMRIYKKYGVNPTITGSLKHLINLPHWLYSSRKLGFKQSKIDGSLLIVPAWFLVNMHTGKIVRREYNASFYDHESFIKVYDSLTFED